MSYVEPIATESIAGYVASRDQPTTAEAIRIHSSMSQRAVYRNINMLKDMGVSIRGECDIGYELKRDRLRAWLDEVLYGQRPAQPRARDTTNEEVRLNA